MQRKKLGTSLPMLSPEAAAFLKAAEPTPSVAVLPAEEPKPALSLASPPQNSSAEIAPETSAAVGESVTPAVPAEEQGEQARAPKAERERKEKRVVVKEVSDAPEVLVADSFKLPQSLHRKLLRASSERKLDRMKPYTKQDIVAVALAEWLSKHGYGAGE